MKDDKVSLVEQYVVGVVKEDIDIDFLGIPHNLALKWCDGMIGAIPVFKDIESANNYSNGEAPIYKIYIKKGIK